MSDQYALFFCALNSPVTRERERHSTNYDIFWLKGVLWEKKILLDLNQVLQTKEGEKKKISKHEILSVSLIISKDALLH